MTGSSKIIIIVTLIVIAGLGIWWSANNQEMATTPTSTTNELAETSTKQNEKSADASKPLNNGNAAGGKVDVSDESIDKDLKDIDNQLNELNADSANADKGLSEASTQ